ncbi:PIN domain-like protein [Lentinula raphanica]|nr:PIN domain-like protein [Lentinula raphanica]
MGIPGIWQLVQKTGVKRDLADIALAEGYILNHHRMRIYHIGIDASILLDSFQANANIHSQLHFPVNKGLTQLFKRFCQFYRAGVRCTLVFDGPQRGARKRGRAVITDPAREPLLYRQARNLSQLFGFNVHQAAGDAEAELAEMNRRGIVDAVLTTDSDSFALGTPRIMTIATEACTETKLVVNIYEMSKIRTELGLTRDNFIFFAFLVGNDYDNGVPGIGIQTVAALLQSGLGPSLVTSYARWAPSPNLLATYFQELKQVLITELRENRRQKLRSPLSAAASALHQSQFPSPASLKAYLDPPTTWSDNSNAIETKGWNQRAPDISGITEFCRSQIGWSDEQSLMRRLSRSLWPAVITFMLTSKTASYDPSTQEVQLTSTSNEDDQHNGGGTLKTRKSHEKIQVTFDIAGLIVKTGINAGTSLPIRVDVPIPIMATITQQRKITAFGMALPPLDGDGEGGGSRPMKRRKVELDDIEAMSSSNESIEISDISFAQCKREVIDITSSDDEGQQA